MLVDSLGKANVGCSPNTRRLLRASRSVLLYTDYQIQGPRSVSGPTWQLLCRNNMELLLVYNPCSAYQSSADFCCPCDMQIVEDYYFDEKGYVRKGRKEGLLLDDYSRKESIAALIYDDMDAYTRLSFLAYVNTGAARYWLQEAADIIIEKEEKLF